MARDVAKTATVASSDDARWAAVVARDQAADGAFVYAVASTSFYCRPSCPSRRANQTNVTFHAIPAEPEAAGYRLCKHCRPHEDTSSAPKAAKIIAACRMIETAEQEPTLAVLANAAGLSPFHFHRIFKSMTGVTPKAYAVAHRQIQIRAHLGHSRTITEAIHESGFQSAGRFYATANEVLGMKPKTLRAGGQAEKITFALGQCSLGAILVAASAKGVCAILMGEYPEFLLQDLQTRFPKAELVGDDRTFGETIAQVVGLIERPDRNVHLPVDIRGTAFQHRVWDALRRIPPGQTRSYAEIAELIGQPKAVRAVASACAANPLAVAIPCHRAVRTDGSLSGYRWGIERKKALLDREHKG
jgi:AraC family transcriptional regulator, regulatory protein of adaptative response / methylated-DNA-[protein]-cysteine methyltransferase